MKYYTEIVPFDLAKKLKETGYPQELYTDFAYSDSGELIEWIGRSTLAAPTYAEVIDWFMENGIFIQMEPWHTFALQERMGFVYKINTVNEEEAKIDSEVWNDFASFGLCIEEAVKKAIEMLNDKNNGQG